MSRKTFFVGVASSGFVLGTSPTTAVAADAPYEPPVGSLTNKVVVITGGTTGLGLESAKRLAAAGATIVLTARTAVKGENAVKDVQSYLSAKGIQDSKVLSLVLDLDDLTSVKAFPALYKQLGVGEINVLMNNAGVMAIPERQITKDGFERTFQSNHLGHFVLTAGLFPFLSRSKTTVINVSSEGYQFASGNIFDIDNLNGEKDYGAWSSYGISKLSNLYFTQELQRRANESGDSTWLTAVSLHPGAVQTDLARNMFGEEKWNEMKEKGDEAVSPLTMVLLKGLSKFTLTVQEGASTQVYLAAEGASDKPLQKGAYYDNMKEKTLKPFANDVTKAKQLWDISEGLSGVDFKL